MTETKNEVTPERAREILDIVTKEIALADDQLTAWAAHRDQAVKIAERCREILNEKARVSPLLAGLSPAAVRTLELTGENGVIRSGTVSAAADPRDEVRIEDLHGFLRAVLAELRAFGLVHAPGGLAAGLTERGFAAMQAAKDAQLDRMGL